MREGTDFAPGRNCTSGLEACPRPVFFCCCEDCAAVPLTYALSVKQPWATLLVHGLKTVEVRRWPTARRGRILIHAARVPDPRAEGWSLVPPELRRAAELTGGIIGAGELTECITYRDAAQFAADQPLHRN